MKLSSLFKLRCPYCGKDLKGLHASLVAEHVKGCEGEKREP